jgi:protein-S-isoprenylcysteine O-methyltransferase Ste14
MAKVSRVATKFLVGFVLFAVLPVAGWGVTDVAGFTSHPARLAYLVLVVVLHAVVVTGFSDVGRGGGDGTTLVRRQRVAVLLLQVLSLAIITAAPWDDRRDVAALGMRDAVRYAGLGLFALGFVGMSWAEAALGRNFSVQVTVQQDHELVTQGPYRTLRHPRYVAIILYNLGVVLAFDSGLALILVAALTVVLVWRIHDEEALMRQQFGAAWEAYCRRSGRLIPFLY